MLLYFVGYVNVEVYCRGSENCDDLVVVMLSCLKHVSVFLESETKIHTCLGINLKRDTTYKNILTVSLSTLRLEKH